MYTSSTPFFVQALAVRCKGDADNHNIRIVGQGETLHSLAAGERDGVVKEVDVAVLG